MNELIKIEEKEGIKTVNARDLHTFLEVEQRFNDWIGRRIKKYDFVAGQDFTLLTQKRVSGNNAVTKEYHISIDMAKELSMVENNDKGREARKFFIQCEKELRQQAQIPATYGEALLEAGRLAIENDKLQIENEKMKPAVQFYEDVTGSNDAIPMGEVAKVINCGMGRNQMFGYLRKKKVLQSSNVPYQRFVDYGWFRVIESKYIDRTTGDVKINIKTLVYQKGIDNIIKNLREDGLKED